MYFLTWDSILCLRESISSHAWPEPKLKASPKKEVKSVMLVDDSDVGIIDSSPSRFVINTSAQTRCRSE